MRRLLASAVLLFAAAAGRADPPTADEIQGWIRDLDSSSFRTRERAAKQLKQAGADAAPALAKAAKAGSPEVSDRALRLLGEMAEGNDAKTEAAARRQLRRLADGESRVAADAKRILNRKRDTALTQFLFAGARYGQSGNEVRSIDLDTAIDLPALVPVLKEFPEVEELSISNRRFTDAEAKYLADLPNLRDLNLYQSDIGDAGLKHLTGLKNLRRLPMGRTKVTDAGLKVVGEMTRLKYVGVRGNNVTDAGLVHLKGLTDLTGLNLAETKMTDEGLKVVVGLTRLQDLYLDNTAVTDDGLERLKDLKNLRYVTLQHTKTTAAGRARLRETLPDLRIRDDE